MAAKNTVATERPVPTALGRSRPPRPLWSRFSTAHGLMVLSGLLTFVLVVTAMGGPEARLTVAAARGDIPSGAPLTLDLLRGVQLPADRDLATATVAVERLARGDQVAARPIAAGELLRPSDLAPAGLGTGKRLRATSPGESVAVGASVGCDGRHADCGCARGDGRIDREVVNALS